MKLAFARSWLFSFLTVDFSDMDLVLPLLFVLYHTGHSHPIVSIQTSDTCYANCPPGYYKDGDCDDGKLRCGRCADGTFTEIENSIEQCLRCGTCNFNERAIQNCSASQNIVCDCREGYYNTSYDKADLNCQQCNSKDPDNPDYKRKCQVRIKTTGPNSTLNCGHGSCNTNTPTPSTTPSTSPSTSPSTTPSTAPFTPSSKDGQHSTTSNTSNPSMEPLSQSESILPWLFLMVGFVAFLVLFWTLTVLNINRLNYRGSSPCCSANKDLQSSVEDHGFNAAHPSHQDSSPTTLTLKLSEETPMMTLSPATPEQPTYTTPPLPGAEYKDPRQDEQSKQWPAIVLYAIIKEVPLRRWKEFLRLLSVADQQLERVELEAGASLGSMERQYLMLKLWSQRPSANMNDVFSALYYMDLSGCAQLLQESLEKLQWRPQPKHGVTDRGFSGSIQDT